MSIGGAFHTRSFSWNCQIWFKEKMHRGEKMFNRILTYLDYVATRGFYLGVFPTPDANVKGVLVWGSPKTSSLSTMASWICVLQLLGQNDHDTHSPHVPSQTQPKPKHLPFGSKPKNNTPNAQNAKNNNRKNTHTFSTSGVPLPRSSIKPGTRTPLEGTEAIGDPKDVLLAENGTLFVSDEASHLGGFW